LEQLKAKIKKESSLIQQAIDGSPQFSIKISSILLMDTLQIRKIRKKYKAKVGHSGLKSLIREISLFLTLTQQFLMNLSVFTYSFFYQDIRSDPISRKRNCILR